MTNIVFQSITLDELTDHLTAKLLPIIEAKTTPQPTKPDHYLSRKEAAKYLGVSLPTLDELSKNGKIKFSRIGRIKRFLFSDLVEAMDHLSNSKNLRR